jgi:hypothetical protein
VALGAAGVALLGSGRDTAGTVLLVFAVLFGMATIFMTASYFAQKATDRAIQKEYELLALYGLAPEKAKRADQGISMTDDGEITLDSLTAEPEVRRTQGE